MSLEAQRLELERLGFQVLESAPDSITAIRKKWHWDCIFTRITYVAFLRKVGRLSAAQIESDRQQLMEQAKQIGTGFLPRGFQKGVAVLALYFADEVDESARQACETKPKVRFAYFYLPSARDRKTGSLYYLKQTPYWGYLYYGKFRFLVERLFSPSEAPASEPLSGLGIGMTVFVSLVILLELAYLTRFF